MRHLLTEVNLPIPDSVTITSDARVITVKGPLGTLKRAFKHASVNILKPKDKNLKLQLW